MKTTFNKIKYAGFLFALATLALFIAPSPSYAEEKTAPEITELPKICERVDEIEKQVDERIAKFEDSREKEKSAKAHTLEEEWEKEDALRASARVQADAGRKLQIDALMQGATTEEQKNAVTVFAKSLDSAISELRESTDVAIDAYHKSVLEARDARTIALDKVVADYKVQVEKEFTTKKNNCGNTVAPVRELELKSNLEKFRLQFNKNISTKDTITLSINKFAKVRKEAILKAENIYKSKVKSATEILKAALGQ
jgi:hypothetical protein